QDAENLHFEKFITDLKTEWRGQQLGEQQNAVWAAFKDKVPRRHRTVVTAEALVDILVDRGYIVPWDARQLLELSRLFPASQQASNLIAAYNKITTQTHQGNACSMCQAGQLQERPAILALQPRRQHNEERMKLLSAILYLCQRFGDRSWRDLVRRFQAPFLVREADINRIEAMPCATSPGLKNCPKCSSYEALYPWSKRHSKQVDVAFLQDCLKKELGLRCYSKELEGDYHMSGDVDSKCLLAKADVYPCNALPEESVPIRDLVRRIMDREYKATPL
ncbi:unnamed protein product, partial [Ixodes hexagonus]